MTVSNILASQNAGRPRGPARTASQPASAPPIQSHDTSLFGRAEPSSLARRWSRLGAQHFRSSSSLARTTSAFKARRSQPFWTNACAVLARLRCSATTRASAALTSGLSTFNNSWLAGDHVLMAVEVAILMAALALLRVERVLRSVVCSVALNLKVALNHRTDRYLGH